MKHSILMAVAGGLLAQTMSPAQNKKHDLFYKADMRVQKRICMNVKNITPVHQRSCHHLV